VKVVLSGEGGDELFAGYAKYILDPFSRLYRLIPARLEGPLVSRPVENLPFVPRRLKSAVRSLRIRDEAERFASYFASLDLSERALVLSPDFLKSVRAGRCPEASQAVDPDGWEHRTPMDRMFYGDLTRWLPDNLLERGDRITMAASLEGRVPLLDHKLVEFASRIPARWKRRGFRTKVILKESLADLLPASVLHRRKVGFTVPVREWFRNELREWVTDILCSETTRNRGIFRDDQVRSILDRHVSGKGDFSKHLWMLVNLELWFRGLG
jgi:asparagine synthase (glutamine-hydrolysing)